MASSPTLTVRPADWAQDGERCLAIRRQVFIEEQQIDPEIEIDGQDPDCAHALASLADQDVGTGRLLPDGRIGRVAVLPAWRGQGIGEALMDCLIALARDQGHQQVRLAAQESAFRFYLRLGFAFVGEPFFEAGIRHQRMQRAIDE